MNLNSIKIAPINSKLCAKQSHRPYAVCWIKEGITGIEIGNHLYENVSNSIFFLNPIHQWEIIRNNNESTGFIMYLSKEVLDTPVLKSLHINKVRLFHQDEIPLFKLSPGIEKRIQAILEMIDELSGSQLNHKEEAILSLLNTFFVYCNGQCNIKSVVSNNNAKTNIVYNFKRLVDKEVCEYHKVSHYASNLNISSKYLNECVQEILSTSAKSIIVEQLLMRSRHELKFSNKTLKEISFGLGFSSPDYFSYFFKSHTGINPSILRKG